MRRRSARGETLGGTLFPFLAVLICTMGALIVLLVVIARQARLEAAQPDEQVDRIAVEEYESQLELAQVDLQLLSQSRAATAAQLQDEQLRLSGIEQNLRRLQDEYVHLREAAAELSLVASTDDAQLRELEQQAERLRDEIDIARTALKKARKDADTRPQSYAIIPYRGPNGTRRRPVYIECKFDRVVLQPEGIVLFEDDFQEPLGPGNALASAIRATREFEASRRGGQIRAQDEPYPLLLVRPNAVVAYYVARRAIKSWGADFGYELIDSDWKVEFPQKNPELAQIMQRAVDEARARQKQLRRAAPRRFGRSTRSAFSVTDDSNASGGGLNDPVVNRPGGGNGGGSGYDRLGQTASGAHDRRSARSAPVGSAESGTSQSGTSRTDTKGADSGGTGPGGVDSGDPPTTSQDPNAEEGTGGNRPGRDDATTNEGQPHGEGSHSTQGESGQSGGGPSQSLANTQSLSGKRGSNWGLPNRSIGATGITRPVRVICFANELILLRNSGSIIKRIPYGRQPADTVDTLIAAVRKHTESWGIAGDGLYWRPILRVEVHGSAEHRYRQLQILLDDSGLQIQRRGQ